uniref:Uncharacterized protein n=1 Tax=Arundo donax TaxID=35708 RepID=A0A0A8YZU0_ARUDO
MVRNFLTQLTVTHNLAHSIRYPTKELIHPTMHAYHQD